MSEASVSKIHRRSFVKSTRAVKPRPLQGFTNIFLHAMTTDNIRARCVRCSEYFASVTCVIKMVYDLSFYDLDVEVLL